MDALAHGRVELSRSRAADDVLQRVGSGAEIGLVGVITPPVVTLEAESDTDGG